MKFFTKFRNISIGIGNISIEFGNISIGFEILSIKMVKMAII